MKHSWNIKNFPKVTTFKCCFYTRTPSQSCHRVLLSFRTLPYRNRCISSDLTIFPPTNTGTVSVVLRWFSTPSFWRWKPNAPSPGLRQRHAWTFRNSRSAKPDLKCPGRIWHFMILDSCLSVQSQPFGDFKNHFKKNIKMQIPSKFLEQNGNFSKFSGWFGEIGSHLGRCKFPSFPPFFAEKTPRSLEKVSDDNWW